MNALEFLASGLLDILRLPSVLLTLLIIIVGLADFYTQELIWNWRG